MKSDNISNQALRINIAKYAVLAIILIFVYNVFSQTYADSSATVSQLESAVMKVDTDELKATQSGTDLDIKKMFGLNVADYEGAVYNRPVSNMDAQELLIIRAASTDQTKDIENAVKSRIDKQKKVFEGYAPKQYDMLCDAKVVVKGRFVMYVTANNSERYISAFNEELKRS